MREYEWVFAVTIQQILAFILLLVLTGDFSLNLSHHMEVTAMTENILETIRKGVQDFVAQRYASSRRTLAAWVRSSTVCTPSSMPYAQRFGQTSKH